MDDTRNVPTKAATPYSTPALFPQRLLPPPNDMHQAEIREVFSKRQVNIPLLDVIKQIPAYAKFNKDLCTDKHRLHVKKKASLTEHVSSIVQNNTPAKFKDPGSPTTSCTIGTRRLGKRTP